MRVDGVRYLRDPRGAQTLELVAFSEQNGHVVEGVLRRPDGTWIPIIDGVPSFLTGALRRDFREFAKRHGLRNDSDADLRRYAEDQAKTSKTFSDKWRRFKNYGIEPQHKEFLFGWYCKKFGVPDHDALVAFYRDRRRVLEVGPGSGFNTRFIAEHCRGGVFALDVSDAAYTTYENTLEFENCLVVQADLMEAPFEDEFFDLVIADGVLHHTPDTRAAVEALYRLVAPGGQLYFYVYRKMGPARQFADRYIREHFTKLEIEECYAACEGLTELGRELSRLNSKITLKKPIPIFWNPRRCP